MEKSGFYEQGALRQTILVTGCVVGELLDG